MRMDTITRHHEHMARLAKLGEHWHEKLWDGSGAWSGDRFLNLYHHVLTDKIEVRYEIPNQAPQLVFSIDLADFDIDKLCAALARADNRTSSVEEKMAAVDSHNDRVKEASARAAAEARDAAMEKMTWAIRKDTGSHIAPLTVPDTKLVD